MKLDRQGLGGWRRSCQAVRNGKSGAATQGRVRICRAPVIPGGPPSLLCRSSQQPRRSRRLDHGEPRPSRIPPSTTSRPSSPAPPSRAPSQPLDFERRSALVADIVALDRDPRPAVHGSRPGQGLHGAAQSRGPGRRRDGRRGHRHGPAPRRQGQPAVASWSWPPTRTRSSRKSTSVKVRREGNKLFAPGRRRRHHPQPGRPAGLRPRPRCGQDQDQERYPVRRGRWRGEGPGDYLRGMRFLFGKGSTRTCIKAFFSMDGNRADGIVYTAVGSHRYFIAFHGPGGHSYAQPSASSIRWRRCSHAVDQLYEHQGPDQS